MGMANLAKGEKRRSALYRPLSGPIRPAVQIGPVQIGLVRFRHLGQIDARPSDRKNDTDVAREVRRAESRRAEFSRAVFSRTQFSRAGVSLLAIPSGNRSKEGLFDAIRHSCRALPGDERSVR